MPSGGMGELLLYLEVLYHISDLLVREVVTGFPTVLSCSISWSMSPLSPLSTTFSTVDDW